MKRLCPKCKKKKELRFFSSRGGTELGVRNRCKSCTYNFYAKEYHKKNKERYAQIRRDYGKRVKEDVIRNYGGKCACCKEWRSVFLAIDHINGGGNKMRRTMGYHSDSLWALLRRNNYPEGYRVLCLNCNWGIYRNNGVCPHNDK